MIEYVDPRAETAIEVMPYELGVDLEAAGRGNIAYLANGFPDSERFLESIAKALERLLPEVGAKHWNKGNASIAASDEILEGIEQDCVAAITAYGH